MGRKIYIRQKLYYFFESISDVELVFAMYEDVDGDIHYRRTDYDTDKHTMPASHFYNQFRRESG
ncbi:hypothetical protein ASF12_13920 [Paenibacillus sp. Leaf72]|nr:hypothetical protein ASF12_13920 [Paenibacillus sp. Leaf72]